MRPLSGPQSLVGVAVVAGAAVVGAAVVIGAAVVGVAVVGAAIVDDSSAARIVVVGVVCCMGGSQRNQFQTIVRHGATRPLMSLPPCPPPQTEKNRKKSPEIQDTLMNRIALITATEDHVDLKDKQIDAAVDKSRVITMQISENISAGTVATLEVLDASTGIRLGHALEVEVAAFVIVEEEL